MLNYYNNPGASTEVTEDSPITKSTMNIIVTATLAIIIGLQILVICACAILNRRNLLPKKKKKKKKEKRGNKIC